MDPTALVTELPGIDRRPLTIGLAIGIVVLLLGVIGYTCGAYAFVADIRKDADTANSATDRKVDALKQQVDADNKSVDARFEANKALRDLTKSNRDLQVEALKNGIDGLNRRADATDAAVSDIKTTLARIAVGVDSIKERLDGRQRDVKP